MTALEEARTRAHRVATAYQDDWAYWPSYAGALEAEVQALARRLAFVEAEKARIEAMEEACLRIWDDRDEAIHEIVQAYQGLMPAWHGGGRNRLEEAAAELAAQYGPGEPDHLQDAYYEAMRGEISAAEAAD